MPWQPAAIQYPDIELWATGHLRAALAAHGAADVYVSNTVPSTRRSRMVICRRDGGTVRGVLDVPRVSFQVWGDTEQRATDLARLVQALLTAAPDGTVTRVVTNSGPTPVADSSGQPLRYLVMDLYARGVNLP